MSRSKRLKKNTGIGLLGSVLVTFGVVGKTIILGRYLDLADFGYYIICLNAIAMLRLFLRPGFELTLMRYIPEFEAEESKEKVSSLVLLCLYVALLGALVFAGIFFFGNELIASKLYGDPALSDILYVLGISSSFYLLTVIAITLLRITENFKYTLIPSVLGSISVPLILMFLQMQGWLNLKTAIVATAIGELLTVVSVGLACFVMLRGFVAVNKDTLTLAPIRSHFRSLKATLGQTSLFGILQAGAQTGGVFLLGVFGGPVQAAIGGMAVQMARPVAMFQTSLGAAVTPELNRLNAEGEINELISFLKRYMLLTMIGACCAFVAIFLLGPSIVSTILKPAYTSAIPAFLVLAFSFALTLIFEPFLTIAVAREEVGRRNLLVSLRFLYLAIAVWVGISAIGVMVALVAGNLTVRIFNDLPLYRRLKASAPDVDAAPGS